MSTFQRRYTDRQKTAVAVAQLDGNMSAAVALAALNAGQLTDADGAVPAPADPMPKSTAHDCARKLRQSREGRRSALEKATPSQQRDILNGRLLGAADRLTRRVERMSRNGTDAAKVAELLAKAARAVREVHAATADPAPRPSRPPAAGTTDTSSSSPAPAAPASPLEDIAADIERDDRRERRQQSTPPQH
jgi:hypothetical protein